MFVHPQALVESKQIGEGTRVWAFAHVMAGAAIGAECNVGDGVFVESGAVIGNRVTIKNQVMIWDGVRIEDDVFLGPGVIFTNDLWPRSPRMAEAPARYAVREQWLATTLVKRGASIGAGAVVVAGIEIGEFALVAAGAVVTKDVAPHALVAGNPARARGWVCRCGARLDEDYHCPECDKHYQLATGGLAPCD